MQPALTLRPIGFLATHKQVKFQALHQPAEDQPERNVLELLPELGYRQALQDLAGFSRIWLLWWFHRNTTWRPLVLPPRGPAQRRGLFATRSPHRPNPIGLTAVQLLGIEGRKLILGPCDLVDGTPVLDIKPYIPGYDAFPDATGGWTEAVEAALAEPPKFAVQFASLAQTQAEWLLTDWQVDFRPRLIELLALDPTPHRTRRIRRRGDTLRTIGCGAWKAVFTVAGEVVTILALEPGYPIRLLHKSTDAEAADRKAQLACWARWPKQLR